MSVAMDKKKKLVLGKIADQPMKRYAPDEIPVDRGQIEDVVELEKRGHRFPKEMRHLDRESHFQKKGRVE